MTARSVDSTPHFDMRESMSDFGLAMPVILEHEGGLADDPRDPGGLTNFGISLRFVREILPKMGVNLYFPPAPDDEQAIRNLTRETASRVYRICWWDFFDYGRLLDQRVATKLMDAAVNMGPPNTTSARAGRAHELAQKATNALGGLLAVDGLFGPKTAEAINAQDPTAWLRAMCHEQMAFYQDLVDRKPQLAGFRKNWLHRAAWPFHEAGLSA